MSSDPYLAFKSEIDSTLAQTHALLSSYLRLLSSPNRSLIDEAHEELVQTIAILEADLEDLEESVLAVEGGQGWGIADVEVKRRRRDLERVKGEIERIRQQASAQPSSYPSSSSSQHNSTPTRLSTSSSTKGKGRADPFQDIPLAEVGGIRGGNVNANGRARYRDEDSVHLDDEEAKRKRDSEDLNEWEEMEQKQIIQTQDTILHSLSGTLTNIAGMAGLIGTEVHEQNELLDDLSTRVDDTDGRLTRANKRLKQFVRKNEEKASSWCILILIIVLSVLLLLVIIT